MSRKQHRSGGKCGGSHTTLIDAACRLVDFARTEPSVKAIVPSYIASAPSANSQRKLMLSPKLSGLQCRIRGKRYVQELWLYPAEEVDRHDFLQKIVGEACRLGYDVILR
ncbi:MAG: DUF2103 domain-containing protein [Patescibacteria group bacterium]|nr:DUF2103 domain-containing protein [Patescibacteria group bacterium]MCL5261859.1 DUF2103 domain-containing protein [Patescibacteria group bacterium]